MLLASWTSGSDGLVKAVPASSEAGSAMCSSQSDSVLWNRRMRSDCDGSWRVLRIGKGITRILARLPGMCGMGSVAVDEAVDFHTGMPHLELAADRRRGR